MPRNKRNDIEADFDINFIISNMPGFVYWKDLNSVYRGCNINLAKVSHLNSPADIIGKKDADFVWGVADAEKYIEQDKYVIATGNTHVAEEDLPFENEIRRFRTEKRPLIGKSGKVIGIFGFAVDITAEKQAEELRLENETQKAIAQEQEKFSILARKVAHDIASPLGALKTMLGLCEELPEDKRHVLLRASESILDISNNLIANYQIDQQHHGIEAEPRQTLLVSDFLAQIVSEKKVQFRDHVIRFDLSITENAQFAFIRTQRTEFRRAISNLINNAADALKERRDKKITIHLAATSHAVNVSIADNGRGMSPKSVHDMERRRYFTEGKENGHGLGLQQVWDMLHENRGRLAVQSTLGEGTTIKITFPRSAAAKWIAQEMRLASDQTIVILDDEQSVHDAWNMHFASLLKIHPQFHLHHFMQGEKALRFINGLAHQKKDHVMLLSDYELLHQPRNGLEIIQASHIKQSILVTSHYANPQIRDAATKLRIKILPKQMASVIPIHVE